MSLTRVFTASSGRISADFRKDETESTRGIGEVLGRAVDDPTAISLEDYTGEDGAGLDASNVKRIIPRGNPISYSDLYGLTSQITESSSRNTTKTTSKQESYTHYYNTQYYGQKLTRKCFGWCNQGWTTALLSRRTQQTRYRTTYWNVSRSTTYNTVSDKGGHRAGGSRPIYRYYRWTRVSDGSYKLTAKDNS